jgi:hypothetical protein
MQADAQVSLLRIRLVIPNSRLEATGFSGEKETQSKMGKTALLIGMPAEKDLSFPLEPVFMQRGLSCYRQPRHGRERG